jgi:hypothetical protein
MPFNSPRVLILRAHSLVGEYAIVNLARLLGQLSINHR